MATRKAAALSCNRPPGFKAQGSAANREGWHPSPLAQRRRARPVRGWHYALPAITQAWFCGSVRMRGMQGAPAPEHSRRQGFVYLQPRKRKAGNGLFMPQGARTGAGPRPEKENNTAGNARQAPFYCIIAAEAAPALGLAANTGAACVPGTGAGIGAGCGKEAIFCMRERERERGQ